MMNRQLFTAVLTSVCLMAAGCSQSADTAENLTIQTNTQTTGTSTGTSTAIPTVTATEDAEDNKIEIGKTFDMQSTDGGTFTVNNNIYTITSGGEFYLVGKLDGRIVIDAPDEKVSLNLGNVSITCDTDSPIYIKDADKVKIKAEENTYNEITDNRTVEAAEDTGRAAIYSECDLEIVGKGSLVINGNFNNGIHTKDDLSIKNVTLKVTAADNCLRGNDSFTMESGNVILVSKGGDGIKTTNSDVSSKGNQRGIVTLQKGSLTITAANDAIHAETDVIIESTVVTITKSTEGLEGNRVYINGGTVSIYSTDDAINACSGINDPLISVNGGTVDVTTPSGDTDAIDSNKDYVQSGGLVIVKGGSSSGNVSGSIDVDGTVTITGGTIVALGGICETPKDSVNAYVASQTNFPAGKYTLKDSSGNVIVSFELSDTFRSGWIASDKLITGTAYTLTSGSTEILSWTQEEGTMGATNNSDFMRPGGFGGPRGDVPGDMQSGMQGGMQGKMQGEMPGGMQGGMQPGTRNR